MAKFGWLSQAQYLLLYLLAFSIPFPFIYSSVIIILLCIVWFFQGRAGDTFRRLVQRKALWFWILFFVLHAVSYMYSTDKAESAFDLESKMSFVVLPIVVGAGIALDRRHLEKIFSFFIYGTASVAVFCIAKAIVLAMQHSDTSYFFYHTLVKGLDTNAVYIAWYVVFSIILLLFFRWQDVVLSRSPVLRYLLLALHLLFLVLLSSKMLIVFCFLILLPFFIAQQVLRGRLSGMRSFALIAALVVLASVIGLTNNPISSRYKEILHNDLSYAYLDDYSGTSQQFSNLTLRLFLWRLGVENVSEQKAWLLGVGNGDVHLLQNEKMHQYGIRNIYSEQERSNLYNVNLHNMFVQTLLMLGLLGLATFCVLVLSPFFVFRTVHDSVAFALFFLVSALFMLQESALQTQAGIVYFTLFAAIFWNYYYGSGAKAR